MLHHYATAGRKEGRMLACKSSDTECYVTQHPEVNAHLIKKHTTILSMHTRSTPRCSHFINATQKIIFKTTMHDHPCPHQCALQFSDLQTRADHVYMRHCRSHMIFAKGAACSRRNVIGRAFSRTGPQILRPRGKSTTSLVV